MERVGERQRSTCACLHSACELRFSLGASIYDVHNVGGRGSEKADKVGEVEVR